MAKNPFRCVDDYIAAQPESVRPVLERVRATIRKALPGAEEVISYNIPAYKLHGGTVIYFAGWKLHFSLYPATGTVSTILKEELAAYRVTKGTIRFPLSQPVPMRLIRRIVKIREHDVLASLQSKAGQRQRPIT